jgi:hypothetical protein
VSITPEGSSIDFLNNLLGGIGLIAVLAMIGAAPAIAILRGSRRSGGGLDWGPQRKFVAIAFSLVLVVLLAWLFSYLSNTAAPSWIDGWD